MALVLQAVQWAIDELKAVVPIWKKEFFDDGSQVQQVKFQPILLS